MSPAETILLAILLIVIATAGVAVRIAYLQGVCDGIENEMQRVELLNAEAATAPEQDAEDGRAS